MAPALRSAVIPFTATSGRLEVASSQKTPPFMVLRTCTAREPGAVFEPEAAMAIRGSFASTKIAVTGPDSSRLPNVRQVRAPSDDAHKRPSAAPAYR